MNRLILITTLLLSHLLLAQVGIGTSTPDPAAVLDINSEIESGVYGGLKLPTINEADKTGIPTPIPDGLMLYVIDGSNRCVELYDATSSTWVEFYCMNKVPVASGVAIDNTAPFITETINFDSSGFSQTDAESDTAGTSLYQWYRADDTAGLNEVPISGATTVSYTVTTADDAKFIRLGVTPTATTGASPGAEVYSSYTSQVEIAPTTIEFDPQFNSIIENTTPDDVQLVFEFPYVSTTAVMVTVSSDDYSRLDETGPVIITIPANQTSPFTTTVFNIEDNMVNDGDALLTFTITNVTGGMGTNSIGGNDQDLLEIVNDDGVVLDLINEPFETDGNGTRYITTTAEMIGGSGTNYFTRTDGSDIAATFSNVDGYYFAAQDIDDVSSSQAQQLIFNSIPNSGTRTFNYSIDLAEDDDGFNQDWDSGDYFRLQYRLDGAGAWVTILEASALATNTEPMISTNVGGTSVGTAITDSFQTFTGSFVTTSTTTMEFRLTF
ncbi:MAG: hypothetical protein ABJD23_11510, partial [Nonlabens sp.]